MQRYKCGKCGRRYVEHAGTILEKTQFNREIWLSLVEGMISRKTVNQSRADLGELAHRELDWKTVWAMRANVMYAVGALEKATLSGVIECGMLQLQRSLKGSKQGGFITQQSDGFPACVLYAIGSDGACACMVHEELADMVDEACAFIDVRTSDIAVACSKGDSVFIEAFDRLGIVHYVRPTTCDEAMKLLTQTRGGFDSSDSDQLFEFELAQRRGLVDRIQGNPSLEVGEFLRTRDEMGLSTDSADEFGLELRRRVIADKAGVSSRYLGLYVGWEEYRHNLEVILGRSLDPAEDSSRVLSDAIAAHVRLSTADLKRLRGAS